MRRVLLPYFDESTLDSAARLQVVLSECGFDAVVAEDRHCAEFAAVSDRQVRVHLGTRSPLRIPRPAWLRRSRFLQEFDAVVLTKVTKSQRRLARISSRRGRPQMLASFPGLEFTPERGVRNRMDMDAVFFPNRCLFDSYAADARPGQYLSWGFPTRLAPSVWRGSTAGSVTFFAQAISPKTVASRIFVAEAITAMARRHSDRQFVVKLRHLPGENAQHVHKERHPYTDLFEDPPENLSFSADSIDVALSDTAIGLTCTSTALLDGLSAGVTSVAYTRFPEHYRDPLAAGMRQFLHGSGLDLPIEDFLRLRVHQPDPEWLRRNLRGPDLIDELATVIERG